MNDRHRMVDKARKLVLRSFAVVTISIVADHVEFANAIACLEKATKAWNMLKDEASKFHLGWFDI